MPLGFDMFRNIFRWTCPRGVRMVHGLFSVRRTPLSGTIKTVVGSERADIRPLWPQAMKRT